MIETTCIYLCMNCSVVGDNDEGGESSQFGQKQVKALNQGGLTAYQGFSVAVQAMGVCWVAEMVVVMVAQVENGLECNNIGGLWCFDFRPSI